MFKRGVCEGEVDSRMVAYRCLKWIELIILGGRGGFCEGRLYMFRGGIFWEGWVDSGRIA